MDLVLLIGPYFVVACCAFGAGIVFCRVCEYLYHRDYVPDPEDNPDPWDAAWADMLQSFREHGVPEEPGDTNPWTATITCAPLTIESFNRMRRRMWADAAQYAKDRARMTAYMSTPCFEPPSKKDQQ